MYHPDAAASDPARTRRVPCCSPIDSSPPRNQAAARACRRRVQSGRGGFAGPAVLRPDDIDADFEQVQAAGPSRSESPDADELIRRRETVLHVEEVAERRNRLQFHRRRPLRTTSVVTGKPAASSRSRSWPRPHRRARSAALLAVDVEVRSRRVRAGSEGAERGERRSARKQSDRRAHPMCGDTLASTRVNEAHGGDMRSSSGGRLGTSPAL